MQFDRQRAFPYPVLRPGVDDYTDGEFQVTVDFAQSDDGTSLMFDATFALSVSEIVNEISADDARYVCVVSCRDTYFRHTLNTKDKSVKYVFPAGVLRGEVQVFPYVVAARPIKGFTCSLINPEFGTGPFEFHEGAILAVDEPHVCYIDRDVFKPISSVFVIAKSDNLTGAEWNVRLSGDKVEILLSSYMKERIDIFRSSSPANRAVLVNSIYFSTVMHCLRQLRQSDELSNNRWAEIFRQQCQVYGIDIEQTDEYLAAQKLLKMPLGLMDTYFFKGTDE